MQGFLRPLAFSNLRLQGLVGLLQFSGPFLHSLFEFAVRLTQGIFGRHSLGDVNSGCNHIFY